MEKRHDLTLERLNQEARSAEQRLDEVKAKAGRLPAEQREPIKALLEVFSTLSQELQVTGQELQQHEDELAATHRDLDAARQQYHELLALTPDGYLVTDARGVIQEANRAAAEMLRMPRTDLIGTSLTNFVDISHRDALSHCLIGLRQTERVETRRWEMHLKPNEGDGFPAAVTVGAILRKGSGMTGMRWLLRDITEGRRLMNESQRQRMVLERLMDVTPMGIAVVRGENHRFELANAFFRVLPGAERPIVGRTFSAVFGEVAVRNVVRLLDRVYQTARPIHLREHQGLWSDQEHTYWDVDLVPLQDLTGAVNGVLMLPRDVSREVRARHEMERLARDLQQERDKLQTIMENTHAQLAYLDSDCNFLHVNTAYAEGAGHSREELIGRNHFDLFPNAENEQIFKRVAKTGEPVSFRGRPFVFSDQPERDVTYWDWSLVPVKSDRNVEGLVVSLLNVTERERLMQQLEGEQARLNAIISNSPEGIVVVDERARITLTNPAADEIYGRGAPYGEDFSSHRALCLCYSDGTPYRPRNLPLTRAAIDGETHEDLELALIRPDGERRDLLVSTAPIRDSRGEITGAVGVFRDISERKRIEAAMHQYAERLRVLYELDQAILIARSAEEIAEVSLNQLRRLVPCQRACVELFDLEAEEVTLLAVDAKGDTRLGKGHRMPLDWNRSLDKLREGRPHVVEDLRMAHPSPSIEILRQEGIHSFVSWPLRARSKLMGALNVGMTTIGAPKVEQMAVIEDVAQQLAIGVRQARLHDRLQAHAAQLEERVAARTAQLEASEARFRAIFEQSALGIALLDKGGRVMVSNLALQEMLGRTSQELLGRRLTNFAHPDQDVAMEVAIYREMRAGERDQHRVETRYMRPGDEMGWANTVLSLVRDAQGEPQFIIAIVEDVTERRRAQEALIQSEKLATTGRLAASLAHEINNPLQTVIGCLGLAEESMEAGDHEVEMYVTMAHDELKRAARIVSRLRDLSRPSDREQGEPTDVNGLIDEVLEVSRKDLKDHHICVVRTLEEDLPRPILMPDRIKQVLLNLVLNARDAMPEGGELTVGTTHDARADQVIITVADQGAGMSDEVMERLFDPFFSTKDDGTGLGLFVSQNIVQEQGGRIDVKSSVGAGSVFRVSLPV